MDGVIVVDKQEDWTSHDVVAKMRRIANTKKIGHLGTLDPIATGVLPLLVGRATRLARFYKASDKVYEAVVRFGFSTDTYDRAGTPTSAQSEPAIDPEELEMHLARFRGKIMQTPPPVSAKKVDGVRAYRLARQKVEVELAPAPVEVYELVVLGVEASDVRIRARCSAGTYVRAIAHELGAAMGCGAHIQELRRTASGDFKIDCARTLDQLAALAAEGRLEEALIPAAGLLPEIPTVIVDAVVVGQIRQGRNFPVSPFRSQAGSRQVKAVSRDGELIAIGEAQLPNLYHPIVVM